MYYCADLIERGIRSGRYLYYVIFHVRIYLYKITINNIQIEVTPKFRDAKANLDWSKHVGVSGKPQT